MSGKDQKSGSNSPEWPPKSSRSMPPQGGGKIIEFVDSQDPNVKSAIQRHTAYHSAAQRREARLAALKRGTQTKYFEWGRRQPTEAPRTSSPPSSTSTVSTSPATTSLNLPATGPTSVPSIERQSTRVTPSPERAAIAPTENEEQVLRFFLDSLWSHADRYKEQHQAAIQYMRTDHACLQLLLAYCYALRSKFQEESTGTEQDLQLSQQYFGRGTNTLWNRLRDQNRATSDVNIQAVLLLMSFTSDFGESDEVEMHAGALRTMVGERGGVTAIVDNAVLQQQLTNLDQARCWQNMDICKAKWPPLHAPSHMSTPMNFRY